MKVTDGRLWLSAGDVPNRDWRRAGTMWARTTRTGTDDNRSWNCGAEGLPPAGQARALRVLPGAAQAVVPGLLAHRTGPL